MTPRQIEETAKLYIDLGKLTFASLILGFFQFKSDPIVGLIVVILGLTFSMGFFILGLRVFKELE